MRALLLAIALADSVLALPALADPWKDESGKGRERGEWKEERREGACKIERKWEGNGEYKEEVKCDGRNRGYTRPPQVVFRGPVTVSVDLPPLPVGNVYGDLYRDQSGRYCREYQTNGSIDGRPQRLYGIACLQPDGSWSFGG